MGTTPLFELPYAELTDAPDGPLVTRLLAETVEGRLSRLHRTPTGSALPTGMPVDFLTWDEANGITKRWDGSAWQDYAVAGAGSGGGGGGGGPVTSGVVYAGYTADNSQPIASGSDVVVKFGKAGTTDARVERNTRGAGHSFTLTETRVWTITATLRFSQDDSGGRLFRLVTASGAVLAAASGPIDSDGPWTCSLAVTRRLPAGTTVYIIARHNAGHSVALEADGGNYVHVDISGV